VIVHVPAAIGVTIALLIPPAEQIVGVSDPKRIGFVDGAAVVLELVALTKAGG
jgi:hypothetical protein